MQLTDSKNILTIDIGSNALRALVAELNDGKIDFVHQYRSPLRLGEDVFNNGEVSEEKIIECIQTSRELNELIATFNIDIDDVYAVATSALRDAKNGKDLIKLFKKRSNIEVDIIDGTKEANLISTAVSSVIDLEKKTALLIDIGGGSTEITVIKNKYIVYTKSFQCGTVRLLSLKDQTERYRLVHEAISIAKQEIKELLPYDSIDLTVGTGGNLRRMGKLRKKIYQKTSQEIGALELLHIHQILSPLSVNERVETFSMREDRADVIIPAIEIINEFLLQFEEDTLLLPRVGLKEGLALKSAKKASLLH